MPKGPPGFILISLSLCSKKKNNKTEIKTNQIYVCFQI